MSFGRGRSSGLDEFGLEEEREKEEEDLRGESFGGADEEEAVDCERRVRWPKVKGFRGEAGAEGGVVWGLPARQFSIWASTWDWVRRVLQTGQGTRPSSGGAEEDTVSNLGIISSRRPGSHRLLFVVLFEV